MSDAQSRPEPNRWAVLALLGVAQLMVVLGATIVNIALPSAQRALHFSTDSRQWVVTAYALAFGSLLLLGGRLGDLFGRKWTFIAGLTGVLPRTGAKPIVVTGMTLGLIAMILFTRLTPGGGYASDVLPSLLVVGVGMGCVFAPAFSTATLGVERQEAGIASAMVNTSQQVGGSVGTALLVLPANIRPRAAAAEPSLAAE